VSPPCEAQQVLLDHELVEKRRAMLQVDPDIPWQRGQQRDAQREQHPAEAQPPRVQRPRVPHIQKPHQPQPEGSFGEERQPQRDAANQAPAQPAHLPQRNHRHRQEKRQRHVGNRQPRQDKAQRREREQQRRPTALRPAPAADCPTTPAARIVSAYIRADGNRSANSFSPNTRMLPTISQYSSGGFSNHGSPRKVGVRQSPDSTHRPRNRGVKALIEVGQAERAQVNQRRQYAQPQQPTHRLWG
jgi:hypothetical protein